MIKKTQSYKSALLHHQKKGSELRRDQSFHTVPNTEQRPAQWVWEEGSQIVNISTLHGKVPSTVSSSVGFCVKTDKSIFK